MKKILAVLLALTMVFAFAACGGKTEEPTEADSTAPAVEESSAAEESSVPEESSVDASEAESTEAASEAESTEAATEATKGLNSEDAAAVVAYYNEAVKASKDNAPKGKQTMKLIDGSLGGDGAVGTILKILEPAAVKALEKNSTSTDYIPGNETDVLVSDVSSATAVSKNGVTTINLKLKAQTDGSDGDAHNGGPVARGVGTLGSIDGALKELGAELVSGRDTVKLTYNNAYVTVKVDEETGKIIGGTWHYLVNIFIGEAKAKLGISLTLKNFKGQIDYTVAI